jgi:hypothetical protein
MTYLFYLPFCRFSFHQIGFPRIAPLFLREDQDFIWGPDLKDALKSLNSRYAALAQDEKNKPIHKIAPFPPTDGENLVAQLWDKHWPTWRTRLEVQRPGRNRSGAMVATTDPRHEQNRRVGRRRSGTGRCDRTETRSSH